MRVLVVGAGIGGLTATLALARGGHTVTLVERAAEFAAVGAGIVLAPNATRLLASVGVDLAAHGHALPAMDVVRRDGRPLIHLDLLRQAETYGPTWALARPALHQALLATLPPGVELVRGCQVAAVRDRGSVVDVELVGRAPRRVDVVVGADGLRSQVRDELLGAQQLRYSGVTCWRGLTVNPGFHRAIEAWSGAARIGVVPLRDDQLYYYLVVTAPPRAPALAWPDDFRRTFGAFGGGLERLLDGLREAPPLHHDLEELDAPVWGRGRVVLLGDAAHAMTPNQGQGAAMAIEDAIALAQAMGHGVNGLVDRYAQRRHARVRKVQLDSRRLGALSHWRNPLAQALRNQVVRAGSAVIGERSYRRLVEPGLALLAGT